MTGWKKGIFDWVTASANKCTLLELHTAGFVSCPFSPVCAESVQENELHFPIINYFVVV